MAFAVGEYVGGFVVFWGWGEEKEKGTALGRGKLNIYLVIQNTYQSLDFRS